MKKSPENDRCRVVHILDAATKARNYAAGHTLDTFLQDELVQLALTRLVVIVGEGARHFTDEFLERHQHIPWREITGTRNRMTHAYFDVDLYLLWEIVTIELPGLIEALQRILEDEMS